MSLRDKIQATLSKCRSLQEMIDVLKAATENPPAAAPTLLDRLIAGEFNNAPDMIAYIGKLYDACVECMTNKTEFTDEVKDKLGEVVGDFVVAHAKEFTNPSEFSLPSNESITIDKLKNAIQKHINRTTKGEFRNVNTVQYWYNTLKNSMFDEYIRRENEERKKLRKAWAGRESELVGKSLITSDGDKIAIVEVGKVKGTVRITEVHPESSDKILKNGTDYTCEYLQRKIQKYEANKAEYDALFEQKRQARIDKENAKKQAQEQEKQAYNAKLAKYGLTAASKMQAAKKIATLEKPIQWYTQEDANGHRQEKIGTKAEWIEYRLNAYELTPDCYVERYSVKAGWDTIHKKRLSYHMVDKTGAGWVLDTKTEFDYACHLAGNADEQKAKAKQLLAEIAEYNEKHGF